MHVETMEPSYEIVIQVRWLIGIALLCDLNHASGILVDFEICPYTESLSGLQSKNWAVESASKGSPRLAEIDQSRKAVRLFENVTAGTRIALLAVYSNPSSPSRFSFSGTALVATGAIAVLESLCIRRNLVERNRRLNQTLPAGASVGELGYSILQWTRTVELRLLERNDSIDLAARVV